MGVDVARFGDDETVLSSFRKGRDARTWPAVRLRGLDTMQVAAKIQEQIKLHGVSAVFVDGAVWVAVSLTGSDNSASRSSTSSSVGRATALIRRPEHQVPQQTRGDVGRPADWLSVGAIGHSEDLIEQLAAPMYGFSGPEDAIVLEKKSDMKKRESLRRTGRTPSPSPSPTPSSP